MIRVQQTRSPIRRYRSQRATLIGLGLNRIGRIAEVPDTPASHGMIAKVRHLVRVIDSTPGIVEPELTYIVLACDESGAKGYADNPEKYPGEVGVFAAIVVPSEVLPDAQRDFDTFAALFASSDGKLHITELSPEDQERLRNGMYSLIRKHQLPCLYEAIHVEGFRAVHTNLTTAIEKGRAARRSAVKLSGNKISPPSLHVTLFQGIYGKLLAFCLERDRTRLHIEVRTDKVDSSIVSAFKEAAVELVNYGARVKKVTGFDPAQNKIVSGAVLSAPAPPETHLPITVEHLELRVVDDSDGLVVASDVLSNSLVYLFRTRPDRERFRALNTPEAFERHPLRENLDSFWRWDGYNLPDMFYRHPKDPALTEQES